LARRAARDLRLTLRGAAVIGDKRADVDLARNLGIDSVHVLTGHGRNERRKHGAALRPTHTARNLLAAARWLLRRR
jgi:phosphoglycolate phosphatase-like HAD superfamily hydrolase